MATIAAMPSTMDIEKSNSLRRLRRLSRQAMRKNHVHAGRARVEDVIGSADISGREGCGVFHHLSAAQANDAIGAAREFDVMRHQHECRVKFPVHLENQIHDRAGRVRIEITGRFVREKNVRAIDESAGERDSLLFAAT